MSKIRLESDYRSYFGLLTALDVDIVTAFLPPPLIYAPINVALVSVSNSALRKPALTIYRMKIDGCVLESFSPAALLAVTAEKDLTSFKDTFLLDHTLAR